MSLTGAMVKFNTIKLQNCKQNIPVMYLQITVLLRPFQLDFMFHRLSNYNADPVGRKKKKEND